MRYLALFLALLTCAIAQQTDDFDFDEDPKPKRPQRAPIDMSAPSTGSDDFKARTKDLDDVRNSTHDRSGSPIDDPLRDRRTAERLRQLEEQARQERQANEQIRQRYAPDGPAKPTDLRPRSERFATIVERYDTDDDGQLDAAEKDAVRRQILQRFRHLTP